MRERSATVGAELTIESGAGGTVVTVELPLDSAPRTDGA